MKRMSLLSLFTLPITLSFNLIGNGLQKTKQETSFLSNPIKQNKYLSNELWYKTKSKIEITQLKNNLIGSIDLIDNQVVVNEQKLIKKLWLEKYDFLINKNYQETLNFLYKFNLLEFKNKKPIFTNKLSYSQSTGIWFESNWWWFGYWKMHFENDLIKEIASVLADGGDLTGILTEVLNNHPAAVGSQIISAVLSLGGFVWDKIPRLTIHFYLVAVVFVQPW